MLDEFVCNSKETHRKIERQRGFFIAEVMVALLLLTVLGALLGAYVFCGKLANASGNETTAAFLAQKQMACVQGNPAVLQSGSAIPWLDAAEKLPIEKNGVRYAVETAAKNVDGEEHLKKVRVNVSWHEFHGVKEVCIERLVRTNE